MTITNEQRRRRAAGIGGSDAPVIVGASPWKTPLALWLEKREGIVSDDEPLPSLAMELGNVLEPYVAERWARETGNAVREADTLTHPTLPFLIGHPDRLLANVPEGLECKVVGTLTDEWGPSGSDLVPAYVHIQCDHYLLVSGLQRWHVAALIGMRELRHYVIERDEALIQTLSEKEIAFWRMVEDGTQPPMMTADDARRLFPVDAGTAITATTEILELIEQLKHVRSELKDYEAMNDTLSGSIQLYMGACNKLLHPVTNAVLATWSTAKQSERVDITSLRKEYPDLCKRFSFESPGSRRFLLK